MANRIRGNVMIVDTGAEDLEFPADTNCIFANTISFWASDSTGLMEISLAAASNDIIVKMQSPVNQPNTTNMRFSEKQKFTRLHCNSITAGTGFFYMA